MQFRKKNRCL